METKKLNWEPSLNETGTGMIIYSNIYDKNVGDLVEMIVDEPFMDSLGELGKMLEESGFAVDYRLDQYNNLNQATEPMICVILTRESDDELGNLRFIAHAIEDKGVVFSNEY